MYQFCLIVFVIIAIILIVLIMLQQDNGNSLGGGFESRALGDMLNSGDFGNNITRLIVILAVLFFLFSLLLGNMNSKCNQTTGMTNGHQSLISEK